MPALDDLLREGAPPVIAILRGVTPAEVIDIGAALMEAGIRIIEVPLNSPDPFASVTVLQETFGDRALIGAGTVLDCPSVDRLAATGARLLVAPNTDPAVIGRTLEQGLEGIPGFVTPSEALAAVAAGARHLKLFPARALGPAYLEALREILPDDTHVWAVGGIYRGNMESWFAAGAEGIGLGGALYRRGQGAAETGMKAAAIVAAWNDIKRRSA
jgi:2-dehydro-3-deoxyphosphogalactonate aldolase